MGYLEELAGRLGVPFSFAPLTPECRAYLLAGGVVINQELAPERAHWAYCHEVAHLLLDHAAALPRDDAEERQQENEANRLAAELLLPAEQFKPHLQATLRELKRLFPFASYEAIARRRLYYRNGLLSIIDNNKISSRVVPEGWNLPRQLLPLEAEALQRCLEEGEEVILRREGMQVEATYVDEGRGVVRVILFLEEEEG